MLSKKEKHLILKNLFDGQVEFFRPKSKRSFFSWDFFKQQIDFNKGSLGNKFLKSGRHKVSEIWPY